jgi:hypothetical protein
MSAVLPIFNEALNVAIAARVFFQASCMVISLPFAEAARTKNAQ